MYKEERTESQNKTTNLMEHLTKDASAVCFIYGKDREFIKETEICFSSKLSTNAAYEYIVDSLVLKYNNCTAVIAVYRNFPGGIKRLVNIPTTAVGLFS